MPKLMTLTHQFHPETCHRADETDERRQKSGREHSEKVGARPHPATVALRLRNEDGRSAKIR